MQYDNPVSSTDLQAHLDAANISDTTVAAISSLLGLETVESVGVAGITGNTVQLPATGTVDVVSGVVAGLQNDQVVVDLAAAEAAGARAFVLQSDANLLVNLQGNAADGQIIVATGNGNDVINVKGDQSVFIDAGDGNDTIVTGNGNNTVIAGAGNNNVTTGSGNDTVILSGIAHTDVVDTGAGYDVVQLDGTRADYNFATNSGYNVNLTSAAAGVGQTASISNAEFLTFANGDTVALAHSDAEAAALRLYQGVLGRDVEVDGAKYFTGQVDAGTSLSDIANQFLNSSEFTSQVNAVDINELYQAILGRNADDAGAAAWQGLLANGGSLSDVAAAIALSSEAASLDQSNGDFVRELYTNVLGREADQEGLDAWVNALFANASRADVAAAIVTSAEAGQKSDSDFIDALYQNALGRDADAAGKADWTTALANGASHADVALGIVGSTEAADHIDNVVVLHGQV